MKGLGYFGPVPHAGGQTSTELSAHSDVGSFPLMVPTLSAQELQHLMSGAKPTEDIYRKAEQWKLQRDNQGLSAFAGGQGLRYPVPK